MKAVLWKGKDVVSYEEIQEPKVKKNWVKLKVLACGFCMTDYHIIKGQFDMGKPPYVLGHEICGEIVEVGENVDKEVLNKRVVVETYVGCDNCEYCKSGNKHLCDAGEIGYPPFQGGEAEYVCIPLSSAHFLPDSITNDQAGIMEAAVCPFGAALSTKITEKDIVLVYGAGVASLSFIQSAKVFNAKKVICVVRNDEKKKQAYHFGADVVIDTRTEDIFTRVKEETNGYGVDVFFEGTGSESVISQSFDLVKKGGRIVFYGLPNGDGIVKMPLNKVILNQISMCGYTGNSEAWDKLIQLVDEGKFNLKDYISATFELRDIEKAIELIDNKPKSFIKAVLHP